MKLFLKNALFVDYQTLVLKRTNIEVEEGKNGKIIFHKDLPNNDVLKNFDVIDCSNFLVTKSFACGHHHAYSALARGIGKLKKMPTSFLEVLKYLWWTLDKSLDRQSIEASALITAIACAKNGVTFVIDHHASPFCVENSLQIIAKAFEKVGISHLLCYEISDRDGTDVAQAGLLETEAYLQHYQGLVGLHASFTVENETLKEAVDLAKKYNSGIHIHTAEDLIDQEICKEKYNCRVVERLFDAGALFLPKTILAHGIHLNEAERHLVRSSKAYLVQNIESNFNNNVGSFDGELLGTRIMLGTDGMHSDMIRSAKMTYFLGNSCEEMSFNIAYQRLREVHNYLSKNNFAGDDENNLVILNYQPPTELNSENFLGHFFFGIESSDIKHVISAGKLIVKDKEILTINESEVLDFARKQSALLWKRFEK